MSSTRSHARSTRSHARLLRDLKEVNNNAAQLGSRVQAQPLEDNLFEWHVNMWLDADAPHPIHLILTFGDDYPSTPPTVTCCTPFPHANVVRNSRGAFTICLDMLDKPKGTKGTPYAGWSSAMSVTSILLQLSAFICDHKLHYAEGVGSMARAREDMARFECVACRHTGGAPWPARLADAPACPPAVEKRIVCPPCGAVEVVVAVTAPAEPAPDLGLLFPAPAAATAKPDAVAKPVQVTAAQFTKANPFALLASIDDDNKDDEAPAVAPMSCWQTPKKTSKQQQHTSLAAATHKPTALSPLTAMPLQSKPGTVAAKTPGAVGKAAKKNQQRSRVRRARASDQESVCSLSSSDKENGGAAPPTPPAEAEPGALPTLPAPLAVVRDDSSPAPTGDDGAECAGVFSLLGYDGLIILLEKLADDRDARALVCTCRHLAGLAEDGMLWRTLFAKHYPASALSAASMGAWKHCFMLELSSNASQLQCFHTKAALGEMSARRPGREVFGIPLSFTVNPRTHELDCVYSSFDTLSFSAYADDNVRRTVWNETFTHFLPLYLDAEHFDAALPQLQRTLLALTGDAPSWRHARGRFVPAMALDVLPKLICTMAVLLADRGVASSDRLFDGYCQLHRLLLAFTSHYPQLRTSTSARVQRFIRHEGARTKEAEPSLGVLVPLLGVASGLRWSELAWPLLGESMDRGVLWACRDHPQLSRPRECTEAQLVEWSWKGRVVANRLLMFHVGFLRRLSKVSVSELDRFHGHCTPWLRAELRAHVAATLAVDDWPGFFRTLNVPLPPRAAFADWIAKAVTNSERKKYHTRGMDFSRVQRSGVSAILRKGESVSCSPTIKRVRLEEVWRWSRGGVIYLDASCLAYGFDGARMAEVDYSKHVSVSGVADGATSGVTGRNGEVALRHSGDIVDADKHEGRHTIDVSLCGLSDKVGALYFTLSAWTTALSQIVRPEMRCYDPDEKSAEPLARYELEGRSTGSQTAVVLAKVWRETPTARWKVTAIGELCMGRVGNYRPLHAKVRELRKAAGEPVWTSKSAQISTADQSEDENE